MSLVHCYGSVRRGCRNPTWGQCRSFIAAALFGGVVAIPASSATALKQHAFLLVGHTFFSCLFSWSLTSEYATMAQCLATPEAMSLSRVSPDRISFVLRLSATRG